MMRIGLIIGLGILLFLVVRKLYQFEKQVIENITTDMSGALQYEKDMIYLAQNLSPKEATTLVKAKQMEANLSGSFSDLANSLGIKL